MKFLFIFILSVTQLYSTDNHYNISSEKIINYAHAPVANSAPTLQDYKNIDLLYVQQNHVKEINKKIIQIAQGKKDKTYVQNNNQNYQYNFTNYKKVETPIEINNSRIYFGNLNITKNKSVFLRIYVKSSKLGNLFAPKVKITYKGKTYLQTFEEDTKGDRYINLSHLDISNNSELKIEGKFASIKNQTGYLYVFDNPNLNNKKILIVAPHPDDAEIAAYGLYSQYAKNTYIATITAGDAGSNHKYNNVFNGRKNQHIAKGKKRTIDSLTVPVYGGVHPDNLINLGFFDSKLYTMFQSKTSEVSAKYIDSKNIDIFRQYNISPLAKNLNGKSNWLSLVNNLRYILDTVKPDVIITVHPELDSHVDHKYSSVALFEALEKSSLTEGQLFFYTNHATNSEYYPYGRVSEAITLPPVYNNSIYLNSMYSHVLSNQREKVLALESMSDLRFTKQGSLFESTCKKTPHIICKDYSYMRRASRLNELFFIVDIKNLDHLLDIQ
ncbi:MAG: Unknown protein [uncultured Sulfurovum sp.]|uniref:PIG-L family deacetylase n=1 Tax=uncultured Sulfurovum sp. TaxID=269237 RepID=A0A6S6TX73_9BACT|nr:MAG: Unknown protein [uncultured Sulfurovum sp.]